MSFGSDIGYAMGRSIAVGYLIVAGFGAFVFLFFFKIVPWLWRLAKPWLHQITG